MKKYLPLIITILVIAGIIFGIRAINNKKISDWDRQQQERQQQLQESLDKLNGK